MAAGGGCACKLPAADLAALLSGLPAVTDPRVLAGTTGFDDGAVIALTADLALVQTVDFFTPLVDDPYDFGRIAATNAISDVYAMGGEPLCALAHRRVPARSRLRPRCGPSSPAGWLRPREAGIAIVGGHTIVDPEPKYGLVVSGTVRPDRIWRNSGGRAGDVLVLTKALGTGVVANALRLDAAPDDVLAAAVASMTTLNRDGARLLRAAGEPHAVTDVTGFGLVGHLHELAEASGLARPPAPARPADPPRRARSGPRRPRAGRVAPQPRGGRCLRHLRRRARPPARRDRLRRPDVGRAARRRGAGRRARAGDRDRSPGAG